MRKFLIIQAIILLFNLTCLGAPYKAPEKGLRIFVECSPAVTSQTFVKFNEGFYEPLDNGFTTISATSGYQFNSNLFLGGGVGVSLFDGMPIFIDGRYDFKFNKITPFADVKIIYNFFNKHDISGFGFSPSIGYRFNWGRRTGLNLGFGIILRDIDGMKGRKAPWPDDIPNFNIENKENYYVPTQKYRGTIIYYKVSIGVDF